MKLETLAIHAGSKVDAATGAVTPPIHLSSTFERSEDGGYVAGFQYGRANNPNRQALEECLSVLEGGEAAAAFASGNAAAAAVFQSLKTGDHVVVPSDIYHGIAQQLRDIHSAWGLEHSFVDMTDLATVRSAIKSNTKLIWIETPSNPLLRVTDIAGVCKMAKALGIKVVCDNTFATPVLQKPLQLGCDLVMHSTTKYLGGHSDVIGGAIIAKSNDAFFERIRLVQKANGAVQAPFDCFMVLRGIKTLPYRMRGHCDHAMKVAEYLSKHPAVEAVYYPGLKKHAGHDIAAHQMGGFGGMLSFLLKDGEAKARKVAASTSIFIQATSLGGVESLIEHRFSVEGPLSVTPKNLVRLSVGLEHIDDLIEDLAQALQ